MPYSIYSENAEDFKKNQLILFLRLKILLIRKGHTLLLLKRPPDLVKHVRHTKFINLSKIVAKNKNLYLRNYQEIEMQSNLNIFFGLK